MHATMTIESGVLASSPATAYTPINLFPWNANRALPIKLIQPTVEFVSLRLRQRYRINLSFGAGLGTFPGG
jgi:hypothetical protein